MTYEKSFDSWTRQNGKIGTRLERWPYDLAAGVMLMRGVGAI
jgi:hypothetical protein